MNEETVVVQDEATDAAVVETEKTERTFTQEEVNKIVSDRLKRESAKSMEAVESAKNEANTELESAKAKIAELEAKNAEMTKTNELRAMKERVSNETGVPMHLLTAETEEDCKKQAEDILAFSGTRTKYPTVKDGGEIPPTTKTRESILAINSEKERLKAIRENIELFK